MMAAGEVLSGEVLRPLASSPSDLTNGPSYDATVTVLLFAQSPSSTEVGGGGQRRGMECSSSV